MKNADLSEVFFVGIFLASPGAAMLSYGAAQILEHKNPEAFALFGCGITIIITILIGILASPNKEPRKEDFLFRRKK